MKKEYVPAPREKLVIRSASPALKIGLCLLILVSMAALMALRWVHNGIQAETQKLTDQAAAVENDNRELEEKIGQLGSVQSVQDIAREELGLADPNTIIINPDKVN